MPTCIYRMDKKKKNKTNKKKGKSQELSIGNLRKTEVNCAQCQKQLFGLWKNESCQSCLECSNKKTTVLTMLKSMNRVCEVRINNPVADNTGMVRSVSDEATEIDQSKAEENDVDKCAGRIMEKNKKRFSGDTENKDISPDQKEDKIARRTRRSLNLSNPSVQHQDDCKNNLISNEPVESESDGKLNNVSGTYCTGRVENGHTKAASTLITRRRSSSAKDVLVTVATENAQEKSRSKNGRKQTRLCTRLSVENNVSKNKNNMQRGTNKRRQQVPGFEENSFNKLGKGGEKGKEPEELEDCDNSNSSKMLKLQFEVPEENTIFNAKNENSNSRGRRRRQQSSVLKEVVSSESVCKKILKNKKLKKAGRIHVDMSPENKNCDNKNENEAQTQTDETKRKQRSAISSSEIKRLKIEMQNCDVTGVERVKRRPSNDSQNKSPGSTDNKQKLVNLQSNGSVVDSKKRTRASLNITTDKTTSETEPIKSTVLVDRVCGISQGFENLRHSEDEKQKEEIVYGNKRERRKSSEIKLLSIQVSTQSNEKRRIRKPVDPKQKPPIPVKTLELLRATRGMKPVVLVERMITVKQKVAQQPAKNKKPKRFLTRNKRRKVYNFNKNRGTSSDLSVVSDDTENKNIPVAVKSEQPVSKKDKTDNEVAFDPKQKSMTLRALRKQEYNQSELFKLKGNNVTRSGRKRKIQGVKNYRTMRLRNAEKKNLDTVETKMSTSVTVSKETEAKARNYACEKCKKQFVSELQQKSHELMHRGYFELKLKRIDTDIVNKTEGEIISKEIVNHILKSVFSTEIDNISDVYRNEVCDRADIDKNIPKESHNHATETNKYELKPHLRHVQLVLKRIDLQEAVAMNKHNEGVLVATSVVNDILKTLDNKIAEDCMCKDGDVNIDADNYNKTREVESSDSELEGNINDERQGPEDSGNVNSERCKDGTVDTDFTVYGDYKQTDNQSQKLRHSEECYKVDDNCKVISNNEHKQDKHESNSRSESECNAVTVLCAEDKNVAADKTKSDESQSHRNTDYDKYMNHSVDSTLDKHNTFINNNEHPESTEISDVSSNEDTESLIAETGTSIANSTGIQEDDTYLRSKDNERDNNTELGICKAQETEKVCCHEEENEYNKSNEIPEIMMNAGAVVGSSEGDNLPDLSTKTNECSYDILNTGNKDNTKIVSETDETDEELGKEEKTENGENTELQNITGNEEVFSSAVESNMNKTDSDNSELLVRAPDEVVESYDGTNIETIHHTTEGTQAGDSDSDFVEISKRLCIPSSDDIMKNVEVFIDSSALININEVDKDKESMVNSRGESPRSFGDSDKMLCKDKQSVVSTQEESSVSKQEVTICTDDKTFYEIIKDTGVGSETGYEQMLKSENELDEIRRNKENNEIYKCSSVCNIETNALSTVENIIKVRDTVKSRRHAEVDTDSEQQIYDGMEIINNSTCTSDGPPDTEKMFCLYNIKTETSDYEVSRSDNESRDTKITVKSQAGGSCDGPLKQKIHDTLESLHNTENNKSVSDNRTVCSTTFTNIPANIEDSYAVSKQETESMLIETHSPGEEHIADLSKETNILDIAISQNTDTVTRNDSSEVKHFNTPCDITNETNISESRKEDLTHFEDSPSECISNIGNESCKLRSVKEGATDGSGVSKRSNGSDSQFFMTVSDCEKAALENTSSNFAQIEISEGNNSKIDNQREDVAENTSENTSENEAAGESNYKNVEKYLESFFKDLIVRNTGSSETNIESQFHTQQEKLDVIEGTEKSGVEITLTEGECTSCTTSDYMVTEKSGLYNDSLQNITGMLLEEICSSPDMERKSQRMNEKEATTSSSSAATVMNKEHVQSGSRNKAAETGGDVHRQLGIKSETAPPPRYVSDTAAMTSHRHSLNDGTKADTQGQFYHKNETDFSATSSYSMDNVQRQSNDRMQTILPSANNHITYTVQKQSQDRRETDLASTSSHTDNTRRYSGDRRPVDSPATGSDSIRKHSNDRREADYSMAGSSNTYQRPVNDNRRHYMDSHDTRQYMDSRDNRGNLYGPNWRQMQNRMHPYQHNPHKRNDRGGWRWPGQNNYSHFRHGNNWR